MKNARTILITGVTRGLGRALTEEFVRRGHIVVGCGRSAAGIGQLQDVYGLPHRFAEVDVTDDKAVARWAENVLAALGPPDLLLNNAAVVNHNSPLWAVSDDDFSAVLDVNVKGTVNVIRHFVPAMIEKANGVVVNFSSGWGRSTSPDVAPYCASKWAIEGLTLALSQELPAGMAAIPLNPGIIDTDMLRKTFGGDAGNYLSATEWAKTAAPFLLKLGVKDNGHPLSIP